MLNDKQKQVLSIVEHLLETGRSFSIIEEPWTHENDKANFLNALGEGSEKCVQYVVLPNGETICVKFG